MGNPRLVKTTRAKVFTKKGSLQVQFQRPDRIPIAQEIKYELDTKIVSLKVSGCFGSSKGGKSPWQLAAQLL